VKAEDELDVSPLTFVPWGDELAVRGQGGWARLVGTRLESECLAERESILHGASAWLATDFMPMSACPGSPALWQRQGTNWRFSRELRAHDLLTAAWTPGRTLAVTIPWRFGPPWGYELTVLEGGAAPRPTRAGPSGPKGDAGRCYTRLQEPQALLAFPTGELFVFGMGECPAIEAERVVVERWGVRGGKPVFERLPLAYLGEVAAPAPDNLWLQGTFVGDNRSVLLHFDGLGWTLLPPPLSDPLTGLAWEAATEEDVEALWLLTARSLWRWSSPREPGGVAEPVAFALPAGCQVPSQLRQLRHELWLSCHSGIYTTNGAIQPLAERLDDPSPCEQRLERPQPRSPRDSKLSPRNREFDSPCGGPSRPFDAPGVGPDFDF